jgi:hypothetical protein
MLDLKKLTQQAKTETGLVDWGQGPDPDYWLGLLLQDYNRHKHTDSLNGYVRGRILTALTGRLELAKMQPDAQRLTRRPLFILGLPRSGTTFMQELLSRQAGWRAPSMIEALYPLEVAKGGEAATVARRKTQQYCRAIATGLPQLAAMRNYQPDAVEENRVLMEPSFTTYSLHALFSAPNYIAAFEKADKTESWKVLLRLLNVLSDARRWVLKDPQQIAFISSFLEVIPCDVVWVHRDPVYEVPSTCALSRAVKSLSSAEKQALGPKVLSKIKESLLSVHQSVKGYDRLLHIDFDELTTNPLETAEKIVTFFGEKFDSSDMQKWLAQNPRSKSTGHPYSPEEFGLTAEGIHEALAGL